MIIKHSNNGKFPLVLLHGWGVNSAVWDFVLSELELLFDVYRIDLPGFGQNHLNMPESYDLDAIARLVGEHCPQGSIIVGWSLGGLVAARIAQLLPENAASVCLVAASPCFIEGDGWSGIKGQVLAQFSQQLHQNREKTVERFLAIQAMGSMSARSDVKQLKQAVLNHPAAAEKALSGGLSILQQTDLRESMKALSVPVKGIFGRLDTLVSLKSIELWAQTMPEFEYQVMYSASHAPFISHKEAFVEHLRGMYKGFIR